VSYFSRVAAPNEYHFSIDTEDGDNMQRPEDIIEATDEQLAVWQDIQQIVQRIRTSLTEEDEHVVNDTEDREKLKDRLLKL
jgi:macrodomain Ter protein organizer (MatP/YcbG family)